MAGRLTQLDPCFLRPLADGLCAFLRPHQATQGRANGTHPVIIGRQRLPLPNACISICNSLALAKPLVVSVMVMLSGAGG